MVTFIGYYYFMQTFMPLCMTPNYALTTVIMLAACSKWDKRNDLYFQVTGDRWYVSNFELVFPFR